MNETVEELIRHLEGPDWRVRCAAAYALGMIGGPEAVAALILALGDGDVSVRRVVADALGRGNPDVEAAIAAGRVCGKF